MSVIILHDNASTGEKDKVLRAISLPLIQRTRFEFVENALIICNKTKIFYEAWDATEAVDYFYRLINKAIRVSVDCGLYLTIWDKCQILLKDLERSMTASQLKQVISEYLQLSRISKSVAKQFGKFGIDIKLLMF